jgi:glutathione S-transferase
MDLAVRPLPLAGDMMTAEPMTLYELAIADGTSASPFVWRVKLALSRKQIAYRSIMLGLTDISGQFGGRFETVPVLEAGGRQMSESTAIADWLDEAFPDLPRIFSCPAERSMIGFFDSWLLQLIVSQVLPIYALDAHDCVATRDRDYYRRSREAYFGRTLEDVVARREERLPDLRLAMEPLRACLADRPFLGGNHPNYADMCLLGLFVFVGTIATLPLLAAGDPLIAYAGTGFASFGLEAGEIAPRLGEQAH